MQYAGDLSCSPAAAKADGEDEDAEEAGTNPDGTQKTKKKKATRAHTTTLASSFEKIQVKDLELEFTVDPLFKKTSADFDEGGAAGLLMNHLGSDSTMRVVFDAGDAKVDDGDEADEGAAAEQEEQYPTVDLSKLRGMCLEYRRIAVYRSSRLYSQVLARCRCPAGYGCLSIFVCLQILCRS